MIDVYPLTVAQAEQLRGQLYAPDSYVNNIVLEKRLGRAV